MDKNYGGVVWTKHALERLNERRISQSDAWATWRNPEQSRYAANSGAWIYYRTYGNQRIEVVAKNLPAQAGNNPPAGGGEWLILSVWSKEIANNNKPEINYWKRLLKLLWPL